MEFIDHIGNKVVLTKYPERIVSLVPSQTELLFDLGLKNKIVGITRYCVEPKELVAEIPKVGGTKKLNIEHIRSLEPDLVIANKEENTKEDVEKIQEFAPVWVSVVSNFNEAIKMILDIGEITNQAQKAQWIVANIIEKKDYFVEKVAKKGILGKTVLYFIWRKPFMIVGTDTFINSMLELCGLENLASKVNGIEGRYPKIDIDVLKRINPDYVFLSTEPYPFSEKHIPEFKEIFPLSQIKIVRGDYFSWYGSRMLKAFDYFAELFEL
jgi:ABC-type Fe3+-hydroxamate transport system substrate-binding protein